MNENPTSDPKLVLVQGILDSAFFTPVGKNDWLGYCFGQPALLGLEDQEVFDLFVRGAIACETIYPSESEGLTPLAWLSNMEDPTPVWAHVLASLRHDRPFLFHRALLSIPAVAQEQVTPDDHELIEDFLAQALGGEAGDLADAVQTELDTVCNRGLAAAGFAPKEPHPELIEAAADVLSRPQAADLGSDAELRLWLTLGDGLDGIDQALAPGVLVETWRRWVGAITAAVPNLSLLSRLLPDLALTAEELTRYAPPDLQTGHVINAVCPYCNALAGIRLGDKVKQMSGCEHLVYVGASDEAHLMEVLAQFQLGSDFSDLMNSYYHSPPDMALFSTIVNDLYEMLQAQGRLTAIPVTCKTSDQGFYSLRAFFSGPGPDEQGSTH